MAVVMERLQILVTPEQRRRLTALARARGATVTALVREAIDEALPSPTDAAARLAAARRLLDRQVPFLSTDELNQALDDRFDVPA